MISLILLIISFKTLVYIVLSDQSFNVSGICGYPGEPLSSEHNVANQKVFYSGHTVHYQCVDFLGYKKDKICHNGEWVGPKASCGYGSHNDLKRIVVKDCNTQHIIADFHQIRLHKNFDRFFNSFSTERYDEQPIRVSNRTCLRWHLYLTNRSHFQFVRTDFATVFKSVSKSSQEVPVITAFVGQNENSNRNLCEIEAMKKYKYIFTNKWINFGYKYHFYLSCLVSKSTEPENVFIIETVTKVPLTLDLVRFSVAEVFGGVSDPACGVPEIPVGVVAKPIKEYQLYELFCDDSFINANAIIKTQMKCTSNAIWSGSYPKCKPRMSCADAFTFKPDSKLFIKSIENVFYYNKTVWFAINGSVINYSCRKQGSDSGKNIKSKICLTNDSWNREKLVCNQIDEFSDECTVKPAQSSQEPIRELIRMEHLMPVYGMVAFTSLVVIIIAITSLVLIWKKNNKKEYKDPNEDSLVQNNSRPFCKEQQCEVIGYNNRPITTNTWIDENQSIYRKQYQYFSEDIYDVPPNHARTVSIFNINREKELDPNIFSEPIYDRPKHNNLSPNQ